MLSGDDARAALLKHAAPESDRSKGVHVHKFFAPRLASDLVSVLDGNEASWRGVVERFDNLSLAKQGEVLGALTPHLGKDLARWWNWSAGQPYQRGWQRRAYRSPDRADSHRIPGNALCIVPVSAQHRGRIFLPFADDDPRTAEIIAKVVLLARDNKIKDPTILKQLVG